ncbi:MAG TPA: CDP-alcohol phosphatidyltransferase family protein [Methanomicrobiales archaeon]|nr:CDP-alcohol phosphatidyltransferase family protein [Methanomicrobiales archaeon]
MTLDRLRPHTAGLFHPLVAASRRIGVTPNALSVASFFAALFAGVAFFYTYIAVGVVLVGINAIFDAIDGALAREMNLAGRRGDFIDHVIDRYADIFIIVGIFAGGAASWPVGVFALTGVLMSSYLGTQAQAVGVGRYYGGILGRADRLILLLAFGILQVFLPGEYFGLTFLGWLLLIYGFLGHITAGQRFYHVIKRL